MRTWMNRDEKFCEEKEEERRKDKREGIKWRRREEGKDEQQGTAGRRKEMKREDESENWKEERRQNETE